MDYNWSHYARRLGLDTEMETGERRQHHYTHLPETGSCYGEYCVNTVSQQNTIQNIKYSLR